VHGVSAVPIAPVEPGKEKMGPDASGRIVPIVPKPEYKKLGYGEATATKGWDNTTRKPYEENDIQQVFQEVLGRRATGDEVQQYLGTPWKGGQFGTMQQLVNAVALNPDAKVVRDPFTADEIKSTAKFYLGKDLSSGEFKAISDKKFTTYEGLRNYITGDPTFNKQYVDNLNKINAASFYGEPLDTGTKTDTTKTDTTAGSTTVVKAGGGRIMTDGIASLGGYSDGGQLLRGPGDGVSDDIPATIGNKQPARLADGEFVVPARIVSELGNGSTEAGARKLYAMMDRIKKARSKSLKNIAANSKADKYLPA
jgi:hypothetical protein